MSLGPNDTLSVTLTVAEWNQILGVLGEGRFTVVAPLIAKIHQQGQIAGGEVLSTNGSGQQIEGELLHVPDR